MLSTVKVPENLIRESGKYDNRSAENQTEYRIRIGKCAQENPGLTYDLIREILTGIEELGQGNCSEYKFG